MASPSSTPKPKPALSLLGSIFNSPTNIHIAHLSRILSTASGIDTTLVLVCYSLTLVHSQVDRLLKLNLKAVAQRIAVSASKTLQPGETVIATLPVSNAISRLAHIEAGTKALTSLISDVRTFSRLWGLLGIWTWARGTYLEAPKDAVIAAVTWAQVAVNGVYYVLENGAYLASKGVIRGWNSEKINRWYLLSARCFLIHILLDYIRLWRTSQLRAEDRSTSDNEKEDKIARTESETKWWKEMYVNVAYSPLALHWSLADGYVTEVWVGLLGTWAGVLGFNELWRKTA